MNGASDTGGTPSDPYLQLYPDQVNADQWLNQMHLFRTAGGASNWEMPAIGDNIYTIDDRDFPGKEYGSFGYLFDAASEPGIISSCGTDTSMMKTAIINKLNGSNYQDAIRNSGNSQHYKIF